MADAFPKGYTINFFCKDQQLEYARNEINFKKAVQINFISKYSENEFSWIDEEKVTWDRYNDWKITLATSQELINSDLIISDNHVLPLSLFEKVILMGSFLWHDATQSSKKELNEIVAFEIELLRNKPTSLICLGDMVMPSLNNQVTLLKQGWFTKREDLPYADLNRKNILFTGGGTELINKNLLKLILVIAEKYTEYEYFVDSKLFKLGKGLNSKLKLFSFSDEDFASLAYVICRPGIGILTDCIRFSIPPIVLNDGFNHEINHNSEMINELGIGVGIDINDNNILEVSVEIIDTIQNNDFRLKCVRRLKNREVNGAFTASKIILNLLENGECK